MDLATLQENLPQSFWLESSYFQQWLILSASWQFLHQISLHWWSQDFAQCQEIALFEQWIQSLEHAYGELIAQSAVQKRFSELYFTIIKDHHHG